MAIPKKNPAVVAAAIAAAAKAAQVAKAAKAAKAVKAAKVVKPAAKKTPSGPKFTDYGLRRSTNSLTNIEKQAEHKWRMKNDLDYKHQIAIKKAAVKRKINE